MKLIRFTFHTKMDLLEIAINYLSYNLSLFQYFNKCPCQRGHFHCIYVYVNKCLCQRVISLMSMSTNVNVKGKCEQMSMSTNVYVKGICIVFSFKL